MSFEELWERANNHMNKLPKILLICHDDARLDQEGLARWLSSFSELVGIVIVRENSLQIRQRVRRQIKRTGILRFLDVLAFRIYYRYFLARNDQKWEAQSLLRLRRAYPNLSQVPQLTTDNPNSVAAECFIQTLAPDLMIARSKSLLKEKIFSIPSIGTFVMHPGICPEYRNSHGCFWALANGDLDKVGMTLLRIDAGIDTGPTYGYFYYEGNETEDSHIVIQHRVVLDHLPEVAAKLLEIYSGQALPLPTSGRESATWGQPWLSSYWKWKQRARKNESNFTYVS